MHGICQFCYAFQRYKFSYSITRPLDQLGSTVSVKYAVTTRNQFYIAFMTPLFFDKVKKMILIFWTLVISHSISPAILRNFCSAAKWHKPIKRLLVIYCSVTLRIPLHFWCIRGLTSICTEKYQWGTYLHQNFYQYLLIYVYKDGVINVDKCVNTCMHNQRVMNACTMHVMICAIF